MGECSGAVKRVLLDRLHHIDELHKPEFANAHAAGPVQHRARPAKSPKQIQSSESFKKNTLEQLRPVLKHA